MQVHPISSRPLGFPLPSPHAAAAAAAPTTMIGGAGESDVRPSTPPSSPAQPIGLGRRLLGSIRALARSHPAPPPAAAPKVGLGLLLHLRPDHPRLRPTPSPSAAASPSSANVLQRLKPAGTAGGLALVDGHGQDDQFRASDKSGASGGENLVGDKEKVAVERGVVGRGAHGADGAAVVDDQEKAVQQCDTLELGTTENDGDDAKNDDQEAVGQGVISTAMDDGNAVKDHNVVGRSVIAPTETQGTMDVQGHHNGVDATVSGSDSGIGKKKKVVVKLPYPQRPGKLNCPFYMEHGSCSYGFSCHFHHPPLKAKPDVSWCPPEQGTHGVADILELNRIGLPIRKGARNCTYYMRNGACRYGKHCHFNHPEHVIDAQFYAQTGWEDSTSELDKSSDHHTTLDDTSHLKKSSDNATLDDTSYSKKSSDHATLDGTSYSKKSSDHASIDDTSSSSEVLPPNILRMLLPPQKVLPGTEGKVMQVKKDSNWSSTFDDSDGCCSADSSDGPLCKQEHVDNSDGPLCKQEQVDYPERPGRPECPYYGRSGDCKFASACNYDHPKYKYPPRYHLEFPSLGGEQTEYPERPGEPECLFYIKNGFCGFGAKCWFNHPKDLNLTAQSTTKAKKSVATDEHHQSTRITLEDHMPQQQQYPERPGQPDCRYYIQFGKCKFLSACIFHHPRDRPPVGWNPSGPAHSDQIGPEIDDMPECPFYVKSGKCHFGAACEFRHPKDICSTTEGAFGHRIDLRNDNFTRPENVVQKQEHTMYPERPGEPQCFHYMSHGSCKFQMNCKYHHPADRLSRKQYDSTYR